MRTKLLIIVILTGNQLLGQNIDSSKFFNTESKVIFGIKFSSDGKLLAIGDGNKVKLFSSDNKQLTKESAPIHSNLIMSIDISSDGTTLVSGSKDSTIVIWKFPELVVRNKIKLHNGIVTAVKISPDNNLLVTGGSDNKLSVYSLTKDSLVKELYYHTDDITAIDFSKDGQYFASASGDHTINTYSSNDYNILSTIKDHKNWIRDISYSHKDVNIYSCGDNAKISVWRNSNLLEPILLSSKRYSLNYVLSLDYLNNDLAFVIGTMRGKVKIFSSGVQYSSNFRNPITNVMFRPSQGSVLSIAVASYGNGVAILEAGNMKTKSTRLSVYTPKN